MPMKTEIAPLLIVTKLEQYDYAGATAIAVVMLAASFALLLAINLLQALDAAPAQGADLSAAIRASRRRAAPPRLATRRAAAWVRGAARSAPALRRSSALFLVLPLVAVFARRCAKGVGAYLRGAHASRTRSSAIRLTLLAAAIAVPLNLVFGVAAAWAIAKFDFRGKSLLITLIDLPFAVSPVISGLIFVLLFGLQGWLGPWLRRARHAASSSPCRASCWPRSSSPSRSSRAS